MNDPGIVGHFPAEEHFQVCSCAAENAVAAVREQKEAEQAKLREARGEREFFKLILEAVFATVTWNGPARRWLIGKGKGEQFSETIEAARVALMGAPPAHGKDLVTPLRRLGKWPGKN